MNTVDHRILIQAPQNIIWEYLSNLSNNPNWQVDCRDLAFLTSARQGQGTRCRFTSENGRQTVIEITAWYNLIGYEYTIIDGAPFKENKGRIRLQEVAEGTVVQWTFNYKPAGLFGGLRNLLGMRRAVDTNITDSLWMLWKHISQEAEIVPTYEAKSLMREAPDVEARAHYKPRHPSTLEAAPRVSTAPLPATNPNPGAAAIPEPPVTQDDTRPRPAVTPAETPAPVAPPPVPKPTLQPLPEPEFVSSIRDTSDELPAVASADVELEVLEELPEPETTTPYAVQPETSPAVSPHEGQQEHPPQTEILHETAAPGAAAPRRRILPDEDTANISVFELFGLPKPSETQEVQTITPAAAPASPVLAGAAPGAAYTMRGRLGKRLMLRRTLVRLRRPE